MAFPGERLRRESHDVPGCPRLPSPAEPVVAADMAGRSGEGAGLGLGDQSRALQPAMLLNSFVRPASLVPGAYSGRGPRVPKGRRLGSVWIARDPDGA